MTDSELFDKLVDVIAGCSKDVDVTDDSVRTCTLNNLPTIGDCTPEAILLVQEGCKHCENAEQSLNAEGTKYTPIDISSERGLQLAQEGQFNSVPHLLLVDCANSLLAELEVP